MALAGFSFAAVLFAEPEWPFRIDESLLLLLGIAAIIWYTRGMNRYRRSVLPVVMVAVSFVLELGALLIESDGPAD